MEEVECSECGNRYDSEVQTFCPRCGNVGARAAATPLSPQRFDPRRRRAQAGGVVLIALSAVSIILYAVAFALAPSILQTPDSVALMAEQPGGTLQVELEGLENATLTVAPIGGAAFANATADNGTARFEDMQAAAVNLTVHSDGGTWFRHIVVLQGQTHSVTIDAEAPATVDGLDGSQRLVTPMRAVLGFFIAVAGFVLLAGISAVRLRYRAIAITGAVIGMVPVLILALAAPNVGSVLLLAIMAIAVAFIAMGRSHFQ